MKPILSASLQNCHVEGLDSIVFKVGPPMVRVYLARKNHTLWKNDIVHRSEIMSLGIHQHRTDITMIPLFGNVSNLITYDENRKGYPARLFDQYEYSSAICDGKGGFKWIRGDAWQGVLSIPLTAPRQMAASEPHSVIVPRGEEAAWMICEGHPTNFYSPMLLTNDPNLDRADFSNLYLPMTQERLDEDMEMLAKVIG